MKTGSMVCGWVAALLFLGSSVVPKRCLALLGKRGGGYG